MSSSKVVAYGWLFRICGMILVPYRWITIQLRWCWRLPRVLLCFFVFWSYQRMPYFFESDVYQLCAAPVADFYIKSFFPAFRRARPHEQ